METQYYIVLESFAIQMDPWNPILYIYQFVLVFVAISQFLLFVFGHKKERIREKLENRKRSIFLVDYF